MLSKHYKSLVYEDSVVAATELLFGLQCQHFAELVRDGHITDALDYAQKVLGPYSYKHPKTLNGLQARKPL